MVTSTNSRLSPLSDYTIGDNKPESRTTTLDNKEPISEKGLEEATPKFDDSKILQGRKLALAFLAMLLSVLLIALGILMYPFIVLSGWRISQDQTIIAPALWDFNLIISKALLTQITSRPVIASQFSALNQISWIASAYFLTRMPIIPRFIGKFTEKNTK